MSTFVDATSGCVAHCEAMAQQFPDLADSYYHKMASYCQQKLWHQLTLSVLDFVNNPKSTLRAIEVDGSSSSTYRALYDKVVLAVASKLSSLALAQIAAAVAVASLQLNTSVAESKQLLQDLLTKEEGKANGLPTRLFLQSHMALLTLTQSSPAPSPEDLASIYSTIKANAPLLNQIMPDTPEAMAVNSSHYKMSMTYYKIVGPPEAFYDEAIHYLNYHQPGEENKAESHALAVDLCLAALTGEDVYNLGQVVTNPILLSLQNTSEAWLVELLQACADGSVSQFKRLCHETYASQIASQPALVNMSKQMHEKMTLLSLVHMVFERPPSERTLAFTDIASQLEIPVDQVEWVLMRAFSVQLMEGTMDQVEGTVHVTWVLPRVLGPDQMASLAVRFGEWAGKVHKIKEHMQEQTPPTLAA